MVATYLWNVAICRELCTSPGMLEVALGNSVHSTLGAHFNRDGWYDQLNLLQGRELIGVEKAKGFVVRAKHPVIPLRVVAALTFGFWTSGLDKAHGNLIWSPPPPAQRVLIPQGFPHAPAH